MPWSATIASAAFFALPIVDGPTERLPHGKPTDIDHPGQRPRGAIATPQPVTGRDVRSAPIGQLEGDLV
jgi:hypothetical protein